MLEKTARNSGAIALVALVLLTAFAWWRIRERGLETALESFVREPQRVMGTSCRLIAVCPRTAADKAQEALEAAERELRHVEALMSNWIESSELSRLNRAPAHQAVPLSRATLDVIRAARAAHANTGGAFDATCRPLIELWQEAGKTNVMPTEEEIAAARSASSWDDFEIGEDAVAKRKESARLDLGGIAKGWAIDAALDVLRRHGCAGGLVDVGGDLGCFGAAPGQASWSVEIRDPFANTTDAARERLELSLPGGHAVCTSGDYARYSEIAGRRFSHIIDPRSGRPAAASASVTVIATSTTEADVWATALSVLPFDEWPDALPEGLSAMGLRKANGALERKQTPGFERY